MLKKLLSLFLSLTLFSLIVYFVEPPKSWPQASAFQILSFFLPLLIFLTLLIDILLKYLPHSFLISTGLILLLALYSINEFNYISAPIILLSIFLIIKFFPKVHLPHFRLTKNDKIPKLTKFSKRK